MPLSALPAEVLTAIFRETDTETQATLALVDRHIHGVASAVLYRANPRAIVLGAMAGNLDAVKRAAGLGADVNVRGPDDVTTMVKSLSWSSSLSQGGGQPCAATALHFAARLGDYEMARWLLDRGADVDAPSWSLCRCEAYPECPVAERDGPVAAARESQHPFFSRRWRPLHTAICHGRLAVARLLVARGASMVVDATPGFKSVNPNRGQRPNTTALHWAAARGMRQLVRDLVVNGKIDVNCVAMDNETPLYFACLASPDPSVISLLLELGADPSVISNGSFNKTALTAACDTGNCAAAVVLLRECADVLFGLPNMPSFLRMTRRPFLMDFNSVPRDGERRELEAAQGEFCARLMELIRDRITDNDELGNVLEDLFISSSWSQSPTSATTMRLMLDAGLSLKPGHGFTMAALKHALSQNDPKVLYRKVKLLFDHGADARLSDDPFLGLECPLTWFLGHLLRQNPSFASTRPWNLGQHEEAYISQSVHIVRWLLRKGAMDNRQNEYGATACDRFREIIGYQGDNEVLSYTAMIMAENFKLSVDPDGFKEILVDRVVDNEADMVRSQEEARCQKAPGSMPSWPL